MRATGECESAAAKAEFDVLQNRFDEATNAMRSRESGLDEARSELAALQAALAAAQAELGCLREQLAAASRIDAWHEERTAAELARQQLENELDALRQHGAELAEALADERGKRSGSAIGWSEELRRLRKAVERHAEILAVRCELDRCPQTPPPPVADAAPPPAAARRLAGQEPVVDAVRGAIRIVAAKQDSQTGRTRPMKSN